MKYREQIVGTDGPPGGSGPLAGLRILDVSTVIMVPYATQILADLGAEVISIEAPEGTSTRRMGTGSHPDFSDLSLNLLRNKRSIAIDLKKPEARSVVLRMAATCDVFVTNLRLASIQLLGLDEPAVRTAQPSIVYCHAVGYRSTSADAGRPAYDDTIQAASGLVDTFRRSSREPSLVPTILADKVCALAVVNAILAAVVHRQSTGRGQLVEVPMQDVMSAFVLVEHINGAASRPPAGRAGYGRILSEHRRPHRTADGYFCIVPYSQREFDAIFSFGGLTELVGDDRTAGVNHVRNADVLYPRIAEVLATRPTAFWEEFCRVNSIAGSPIADLDDLIADLPPAEHPMVGTYGWIPSPYHFPETLDAPAYPAQSIGQDTVKVLHDVGFGDAEIESLLASGCLASDHSGQSRST
jgi:crotonobetainyl-CoA:carnitine CoA-transferase CaiB-like acyl-CoA transferase